MALPRNGLLAALVFLSGCGGGTPAPSSPTVPNEGRAQAEASKETAGAADSACGPQSGPCEALGLSVAVLAERLQECATPSTGALGVDLPAGHEVCEPGLSATDVGPTVERGSSRCSEELTQLGGLTQLTGYLIDEEQNDLILLGIKRTGQPPLLLDDLVVALRNAWGMYVTCEGGTRYYSSPGCTIDPDPASLARMQKIAAEYGADSTPRLEADAMRVGDAFSASCRGACEIGQDVRVFGVPHNSHFAFVEVAADEFLKHISDGAPDASVAGLASHTERVRSELIATINAGKAVPTAWGIFSRFWLQSKRCNPTSDSDCPSDGVAYLYSTDDAGTVLIERCEVGLATEDQQVSENGARQDSGIDSPAARAFAADFTEAYSKVRDSWGYYLELENLFRAVMLAKALQREPELRGNGGLEYLLRGYGVPEYNGVPRELPGRFAVPVRERVGGRFLVMPSCGGVEMDIEATPPHFRRNATAELAREKQACLQARPGKDVLVWKYN